jgi:hypothetical protein
MVRNTLIAQVPLCAVGMERVWQERANVKVIGLVLTVQTTV